MKKLITLFSIIALLLGTLYSNASTADAAAFTAQTEIIPLDNGDYIETTITGIPTAPSGISTLSAAKTVTKSKTSRYKNKSGDTLWSVTIRATFSYNGTTSKCTSCSHSTTCPSNSWKIKSASSNKSGNSATAKVIVTHFYSNDSTDYIKSVTISCSKNGTVS